VESVMLEAEVDFVANLRRVNRRAFSRVWNFYASHVLILQNVRA
jgi:hypothetical protein